MPNEFGKRDKQQLVELAPDFRGEDRHELVAKMAYKLWGGVGSALRLA